MSKSTKSTQWFCRVDGVREHLETKCKEMSKQIDVEYMLALYHVGERKENPHCHFVIQTRSEVQKQSFALRVKNLFGIDKKSQYALQVWDGARDTGAVAYMFHEDPVTILVNKGFEEAEIEKAKTENAAVQRVVAVNKEKASTKLVEKLYDAFKDSKGTRTEMLAFMLKEIQSGNNYHPGEFMLKRYIEEVEVRLCDDIDYYASQMEARLWKQF